MKLLDNSPSKIGFVSHMTCLSCGQTQTMPELIHRHKTVYQNGCYACMGPLDLRYDEEALGRILTRESVKDRYLAQQEQRSNFWLLKELLPINEVRAARHTPFTPLVRASALEVLIEKRHGVRLALYLKLDMANPTGSFKDRPVALAFNKALEDGGYDKVITSSTGNLGISTVASAQEAGFGCLMFLPNTLGDVKVRAMEAYCSTPTTRLVTRHDWGMANREDTVEEFAREMLHSNQREVVRLEGTYDRANRFASEVAQRCNQLSVEETGRRSVFIPNDIFRPYYKEGSKTSGYETSLQLKYDFDVAEDRPVHQVYPIGSGALAASAIKGMEELNRLKVVDYKAVLWAAQPEACSTVVDAFLGATNDIKPVRNPDTLAKSIAIEDPGSGHQVLSVMRRTGGGAMKTSEQELSLALLDLFETEGLFCQFVGGVVVSCIMKLAAQGAFKNDDLVVANITGRGLDRIEDDLQEAAERFQVTGRAHDLLEKVGKGSLIQSPAMA